MTATRVDYRAGGTQSNDAIIGLPSNRPNRIRGTDMQFNPSDWPVVVLEPGIAEPIRVTEPTRYVAKKPWHTLIRGGENFCVETYAPVILEGLQMAFAPNCCVKSQTKDPIYLINCWIHSAPTAGIFTGGPVYAERSLFEWCGLNPRWGHNAYFAGQVDLRRCIFRRASAYSLHLYPTTVSGTVDRCLIVGQKALACVGKVEFTNCTIAGYYSDSGVGPELTDGVNGNLVCSVEDSGRFLSPEYGLYWPKKDLGRGCYEYNPRMTFALAKKLWDGGVMYSRKGKPFSPLFPGDPVPE
jgi:hypothetical protein